MQIFFQPSAVGILCNPADVISATFCKRVARNKPNKIDLANLVNMTVPLNKIK